MKKNSASKTRLGPANRDARHLAKEPLLTQAASFVELFVWLLVLKSFFLPLFIIPTGSMAETLAGAHADYTCPNCGYEYQVGFHEAQGPTVIQCPNCRYQLLTRQARLDGVKLINKAGDRIIVHGWPYDIGSWFAPHRWDVVVFKNPNDPDVNFIKRLIGLPGETIEIIDGDIFVRGKDEAEVHPARKTVHAQRALWFPYFDQDYPPKAPTRDGAARLLQLSHPRWPDYHPHWVATTPSSAWKDLETRTPSFPGRESGRDEIVFASHDQPKEIGEILDVYGYNNIGAFYNNVTDVRVSTDVHLTDGSGYLELIVSKYDNVFFARLYADGHVTLERAVLGSDDREAWGEVRIELPDRGVNFALGHADYHVAVEIDGQTLLESTAEQYPITAKQAKENSHKPLPSIIRLAAQQVNAQLAHLRIERDVYYTSGNLREGMTQPGTGTQDHPITLRDDAYFVCGDNSPGSHDSRAWSESTLGPHLRQAYEAHTYDLGTVPADQMIGRAFFVYWPGFMPFTEKGPNLLPDFGRIRWIN